MTSIKEKRSHADYNLIFDNDVVDKMPVEVLGIGTVALPTGKIIVCDPLADPKMTPLEKTVPPGTYPVKIYIASTPDSGDRFAIAKLEFSSDKADKWVLATREGEDISELNEDGAFFAFPVDAGLAGIFDYQAGEDYNRFLDDFIEKNPSGNVYDDFFAAEFKKNAKAPDDPADIGDWINFTVPNSELSIIMFHSGYGDGLYPVFWGMTNDNRIVSLVIDFFVLLLPEDQE